MILYLTIAVATICMAAKVTRVTIAPGGNGKTRGQVTNDILLFGIFLILFLASALRVDTGNDYRTYISHCHDVYVGGYVVTEPGFNVLVKVVYGIFGKEVPLLIFAFFSFGTAFFFLLALYRQSKDFALSFFLFMALGLYFISYNTVRYYFALSIVFFAMEYAKERRWMLFVFYVLVASLFHKTALVVLLLYPLATLSLNIWKGGILLLLGASGMLLKQQYMALFIWLYPSYVNETEYLAAGGFSLVNILRCVGVLGIGLMYYQTVIRKDKELQFYFNLNVGALVLYTGFSFIPFCSRIGYYLNISQLLFLPALLMKIPRDGRIPMKVWRFGVIIAGILYFALFLASADDPRTKILPYHSFIFQ